MVWPAVSSSSDNDMSHLFSARISGSFSRVQAVAFYLGSSPQCSRGEELQQTCFSALLSVRTPLHPGASGKQAGRWSQATEFTLRLRFQLSSHCMRPPLPAWSLPL